MLRYILSLFGGDQCKHDWTVFSYEASSKRFVKQCTSCGTVKLCRYTKGNSYAKS